MKNQGSVETEDWNFENQTLQIFSDVLNDALEDLKGDPEGLAMFQAALHKAVVAFDSKVAQLQKN